MQRDWFDFAAAIGSIATAASVLYLVARDWLMSTEVTDLKGIIENLDDQKKIMMLQVQELKTQNRQQWMLMKANVAPAFFLKDYVMMNNRRIAVPLFNGGGRTYIRGITFEQSHLSIVDDYDDTIERGLSMMIIFQNSSDEKIEDTEYNITLDHDDVLGNRYITKVTGRGVDITRMTTEEKAPKQKIE
jgi:hypothetical protein